MQPDNNQSENHFAPLSKVTPLSKYLAMALFIIMPFIGGWIGYTHAPEKVVKVQEVSTEEMKQLDTRGEEPSETYRNDDFGFEMTLSQAWLDNMQVSTAEHQFGRTAYFELPDNNGNYESVCYVSASTDEEWIAWQLEEMGKPNYIQSNNGMVFGYGCGHDDGGFRGFGSHCASNDPLRMSESCPFSDFRQAINTFSLSKNLNNTATQDVSGVEKYFEDIVILGLSAENESPLNAKKVFLSDGILYVLRFMPMGEGLSLTRVTWYDSPPNEFIYIGGDYINDGTSVIFLGNRFSEPLLVDNADISTFRTISPTPKNGGVSQDIFGLDSKAVYYDGKILDGVDPGRVNFESHSNFVMPVVFDEDTYWYPEGGCDGAYYRSGTKEELETYVFPC